MLTRLPSADREIHLDLRELTQLDYPVSSKQIEALIKGLKFESILQYVQIPRYPFKLKTDSCGPTEDNPYDLNGAGRTDFGPIFGALKTRGVKKIIRLIVDDDEMTPHTDDFMETFVRGFNIEEWNWAKIDIGSEVLKAVASDARKVTLYSSGNSAVLHGWSAPGGLDALKKVQIPSNRAGCKLLLTRVGAYSSKKYMSLYVGDLKARGLRGYTPKTSSSD